MSYKSNSNNLVDSWNIPGFLDWMYTNYKAEEICTLLKDNRTDFILIFGPKDGIYRSSEFFFHYWRFGRIYILTAKVKGTCIEVPSNSTLAEIQNFYLYLFEVIKSKNTTVV